MERREEREEGEEENEEARFGRINLYIVRHSNIKRALCASFEGDNMYDGTIVRPPASYGIAGSDFFLLFMRKKFIETS